jgi:surface antigen
MPSSEHRPRSLFTPLPGVGPFTPPPDLSVFSELSTVPLPTARDASREGSEAEETHILPARPSPAVTRQLSLHSSPGNTRMLTGTLASGQETSSPRGTVVIRGEMKRSAAAPVSRAEQRKRRLMVSLSGVLILLLITAFTLLLASPLGHDIGLNFSFQPSSTLVANTNSDPNLVAQATATAVYHQQTDGYDPYSGGTITITDGSGSLNWPVGQCTYWANYRYHALTGFWVSWTGNADQWVAGAKAAGWNVSQTPHVPSIIVLMPGVQGAWGYGHVAVVESIVAGATPTTVHTSNMNWWADGGGWDKVSYYDFTVGSGVYFVWHS